MKRKSRGRGSHGWRRRCRHRGGNRGGGRARERHARRSASFDTLHELLEAQAYRLSYWRTASHEINYRRFFDVNTLAGLWVERPGGIRRDTPPAGAAARERRVTGVRIDHPDGLFDPARYFEMLQDLAARGAREQAREPARRGARSVSSRRRSCPAASGCPPAGRCTARPATTS